MTLRQLVQEKIDAANTELASRTTELGLHEGAYMEWMDLDIEALKTKFTSFVADADKYL